MEEEESEEGQKELFVAMFVKRSDKHKDKNRSSVGIGRVG